MNKNLLTLAALEGADMELLFERAAELKERRKKRITDQPMLGRSLGLVFDKHSTRTRLSFEVAAIQLGGVPIFISSRDTQMARDEPVRDTARVLSRYLDIVAIRTYSQSFLEEFAEAAEIPVINALTDLYHPCQVLSDLLTVIEKKGGCRGMKIAWLGDGNNMANSWINAAAALELDLTLACPEGYGPDPGVLEAAKARGGRICLTRDPREAVAGADVVNTDVWASMGQEKEKSVREKVFQPYQLNAELLKGASADTVVMHCLPAHRGEEISGEVLEGPQSVVWDQAENKLHMHKAILDVLLQQ
ncbi:MAG: ornithine carbamoyltransferase [Desulfosalsimonadaceae bacterium]